MNATEARKKAILANKIDTESQLFKINKKIEEAVKIGQFEIYYYESINNSVKENLIKRGFKINNDYMDRDGVIIQIEWKE